jgi:serine/threonine-protein kinase
MTLQARYSILRKITDGGTAEIFLATQHGAHGFEKTVVLKRIFPAFYADPQFRNMLVDEAHIAMSLNHSNIVQVLDLGEADGQYVLALELVDGWTLDAVLRRARALKTSIPPALALYMTAEICRALAYAHAKVGADGKPLGIVHRDISPHNVLLSEQGEVKLTDFGIAKAHNRRESSLGNIIKGKIAYMSPEQASGAPIDARSDLFSVGTLLYVMVCRRYPFDAATDLEVLLQVKEGAYEPPEKAFPGLNPEIYRVINHAMAKSPADRYQRADEMLVDVEQVMRVAFHAVGQTELKRWLQDLSMRDGVPPLMRTFVLPATKGASAGRAGSQSQEPKGMVSSPASASLPPPVPGSKPGPLAPPGSRPGPAGKSRPPPPPAAIAVGHSAHPDRLGNVNRKAIPPTTVNVPDEASAEIPAASGEQTVAENPAAAKLPAAIDVAPPVPRKSSSWVAEAVLASAQRAGTTPAPPVAKAVPPPPVPLDPPVQPVADSATGNDGAAPPRRGQKARGLVFLTGIGFAAILVAGIASRTCGDSSSGNWTAAGSDGGVTATASSVPPATTIPTAPTPVAPTSSGTTLAPVAPAPSGTTLAPSGTTLAPIATTPVPSAAAASTPTTPAPLAAEPATTLAREPSPTPVPDAAASGRTAIASPPRGIAEETAAPGNPTDAPRENPRQVAREPGALTGLPRSADAAAGAANESSHEALPGMADKSVAGESSIGPDGEADAGTAAAAPAPKATVLLSSSPPGAQVGSARRSFGTTPVSVKMKVGRTYSLTFTHEGYRPVTKQFRVTDFPDQQVNAVLRREVTSQKTQSEPSVNQAPVQPKPERNWFQRMFGR